MKRRLFLTQPRLITVLCSSIGLFSSMGVMAAIDEKSSLLFLFDLDRELNLATFFSALLLLSCSWLVYSSNKTTKALPLPIRFLGLLFGFMALDECFKIHETLEKLTGVDWQLLYLPLILAAGIGWLKLFLSFRGFSRLLWVLGATAWGASQLLEAVQWGWGSDSIADDYLIMMVGEEILEMSGSALFLLTLFRELKVRSVFGKKTKGVMPIEYQSVRSRSMKTPVK